MSAGGERLDNGILEVYSLNVGQADAAVVITEEGQIILNDADEEKIVDELETVLSDRAVERTENGNIPLVFATTHFHQDHIKGLEHLGFDDYEVSHAIYPDINRVEILDDKADASDKGVSEKNIKDFRNHLKRLDVGKVTQVSRGDNVPIDSDADFSVLAPPDDDESVDVTRPATGAGVEFRPIQANENGGVYKLEGERSALFMGDVQDDAHHHAESWLMQQHDDLESDVNLNVDVLFAAHHGSGHATSEEFLDRVNPEIVIISSGLNNIYTSENEHDAHPHDATLKRLHERDVEVYWTTGHGTLRTDMDSDAARPEPTTDLDTTNAADLAALKYYCREYDVSPDQIAALTPDHLPDETPEWVADSALMLVETPEQFIDEAIEDVRQTLEATPDAHEHLQERVQTDRDEHVTTRADVKRNREAYFSAKRREHAYQQLPLHTRLRTKLPDRFGGIEHPLKDMPSFDDITERSSVSSQTQSGDIDGPRKVEEIPQAVQQPPAAEQRAKSDIVIDKRLLAAADTAVDTAETRETLCRKLRDTPGAHQDFLYAIETPNAHTANKSEKDLSNLLEQTNQREQTSEQTLDQDSSLSL